MQQLLIRHIQLQPHFSSWFFYVCLLYNLLFRPYSVLLSQCIYFSISIENMGINGCMAIWPNGYMTEWLYDWMAVWLNTKRIFFCEQKSRNCMSMLNLLYSYMLVSICLTVNCNYMWFWPGLTENMSDYISIATATQVIWKYANLVHAVATWVLQAMHIHSNKLNTTSSCLGTVRIDVILSYGRRRKSELRLGPLLDLVIH